jgi:hypothetical protein
LFKSGDLISFDLISQEMWLNVSIYCDEVALVGNFELKVLKSMKLSQLRTKLLYIGKQVFTLKGVVPRQGDSIAMQKVEAAELSLAEVKAPENLEETISLEEEDCKVGEIFDFLDNQIYAELRHRRHSSNSEVTYRSEHNRFSYNPYANEDSRVVLRNLTFISRASRNPEVTLVHFPESRRSCCTCILW